jgi:protein-S-isoprenylcysteine O-methyltransferase Ste14
MSRRTKTVAYLFLSWPPHAVAYIVTPVLVAKWSSNQDWNHELPVLVRLAGLVLVGGGAAIIGWAIASHYRASADRVQRTLEPTYLVTEGAYAWTRNPLYLGGTCMWLGWAVLFGSPAVAAGAILLVLGFNSFAIPFEERRLAGRFGDSFTRYATDVPRWVGHRIAG